MTTSAVGFLQHPVGDCANRGRRTTEEEGSTHHDHDLWPVANVLFLHVEQMCPSHRAPRRLPFPEQGHGVFLAPFSFEIRVHPLMKMANS